MVLNKQTRQTKQPYDNNKTSHQENCISIVPPLCSKCMSVLYVSQFVVMNNHILIDILINFKLRFRFWYIPIMHVKILGKPTF